MNTDARRKASIAYKARLAEKGYRQKAFRFSPETLADLERLAKTANLTEAQLIAKLIAEAAAPPVPIQRLDVDAELPEPWPASPTLKAFVAEGWKRSSAKPSAAKVDGAGTKKSKPKIDTSGVAVHPSLQKGKTK